MFSTPTTTMLRAIKLSVRRESTCTQPRPAAIRVTEWPSVKPVTINVVRLIPVLNCSVPVALAAGNQQRDYEQHMVDSAEYVNRAGVNEAGEHGAHRRGSPNLALLQPDAEYPGRAIDGADDLARRIHIQAEGIA